MIKRLLFIGCISLLLVTGCVSGNQRIQVDGSLPHPSFSVKESMAIENVEVVKRGGDSPHEEYEIVWNSLLVMEEHYFSVKQVNYSESLAGFRDVIKARELERGVLYQVGFGGAARSLAGGSFFYPLDAQDSAAINVHFTGGIQELIGCLRKYRTREELVSKCRSGDWLIQGQENWDSLMGYSYSD